MKHFWDQIIPLNQEDHHIIEKKAKELLRKKQISQEELTEEVEIIVFNSNMMGDYIPQGLEKKIHAKNVDIPETISKPFFEELKQQISNSSKPILGVVFENIQKSIVVNYFDLFFAFPKNLARPISAVTYLKDVDFIHYLVEFIKTTNLDRIERKILVYRKKEEKPWKELTDINQIRSIDTAKKLPIILERPFFSEIQLILDGTIQNFSLGALPSIAGKFRNPQNKEKKAFSSGSLHLIPKQHIAGFKIASAQEKSILGISIKGKFTVKQKFLSEGINLDFITMKDLDFIRIKLPSGIQDLHPENFNTIDFDLDSQRMVLASEIPKDAFHLQNFYKIELHKGEETATIDHVFLNMRGVTNHQIPLHFHRQYLYTQALNKMKNSYIEQKVLIEKNIVAGDLIAQQILESLRILGIYSQPIHIMGYDAEDIYNTEKVIHKWNQVIHELKEDFVSIRDVSNLKEFTPEHFERITIKMKTFLTKESIEEISIEEIEKLLEELGSLIRYMDDFFKLDLYQQWNQNTQESKYFKEEEEIEETEEEITKIDEEEEQKTIFLEENYAFFVKRKLVNTCLIKLQGILFFLQNIYPMIKKSIDIDLLIYSKQESILKNYQLSSVPCFALDSLIDKKFFNFSDEEEKIYFIQFVRSFSQKVYDDAKKNNQTFYHQYKHTLTELDYVVEKEFASLQKELELLENPKNKELAYKKLLEQMTEVYQKKLEDKSKNIELLLGEDKKIDEDYKFSIEKLSKLLEKEISKENIDGIMQEMPEFLVSLKQKILTQQNEKKEAIQPLIHVFFEFKTSINTYFTNLLNLGSEYYQAHLIRDKMKMFQKIKNMLIQISTLSKKDLELKIQELEQEKSTMHEIKNAKSGVQKVQTTIKKYVLELRNLIPNNLFQEKNIIYENIPNYFDWFFEELETLFSFLEKLQKLHIQLSDEENQLYKKQDEFVEQNIKVMENKLLINICKKLLENPNATTEVQQQLQRTENIPKEIKEKLKELRTQMNEKLNKFKNITMQKNIHSIKDDSKIKQEIKYREDINETYKILVNLIEGKRNIKQEIDFEQKDLDYLKTQENNIESIVMSKSLPSARSLIKTQYIPHVEREIRMLKKANVYFDNLLSIAYTIYPSIQNTFFGKRYGVQQFLKGEYCIDKTAISKGNTDKNINATYALLESNYTKGCRPITKKKEEVSFTKIEVDGIEGIEKQIKKTWDMGCKKNFLYLPPSIRFFDAIQLCEFKEEHINKFPQKQLSIHSLILIYIHEINFEEEFSNKSNMIEKYHRAILSNIFIQIDEKTIFNNKDSIYENCLQETFGNCNEPLFKEIMREFEY